jgi:hypothetical protein
MTTKPILQKSLQGILHTEDESKPNYEKMKSQTTGEEMTSNQTVVLNQLHTLKSLNKMTKWKESPNTYQYYLCLLMDSTPPSKDTIWQTELKRTIQQTVVYKIPTLLTEINTVLV